VFDALSEKLQSALGDLRGRGVLDEEAISRELGLPVRYVGVGEKLGDLLPFDARDFVDSLFE